MKKKLFLLFVPILLLTSSLTAFASPSESPTFLSKQYVTISDYQQMVSDGTIKMSVEPKAQACCDSPRVVWRTIDILHVTDPGRNNLCVSVLYVGDQYCTNCNSVWQSGIVYRQTAGCRKYH